MKYKRTLKYDDREIPYFPRKKVCLALEMFNPAQNEALAAWCSGESDKFTFIEQTDFLTTWSHNYRYYEAIFDYAREKHIPIYGVNTPRKYATKIGRGGLGSLTEEDLEAIPKIDTSTIEHKFFFKVAMQGMDATMPDQFKNIYPAQCLWDAAMGEGAIKTARENPDAIVVVLAGSGHVVYNLGIGRIIKDRSDLTFASVVTVDIADTVEESGMMKIRKSMKNEKKEESTEKETSMNNPDMNKEAKERPPSMAHMPMMGMDSVPYKIVSRSLADYIWGKKELEYDKYPSLGFSIEDNDGNGYRIKRVLPETMAANNGLKKGDIIYSIDGNKFENLTQLKKHLQYKNWNEEISFMVNREEEDLEISFVIEPDKKENE